MLDFKNKGDVDAMQSKLVGVCHKVLGAKQFGEVMSLVMGAVIENTVQQLRDAGITEKYAAVLVAVGQRVATLTVEKCNSLMRRVQELPARASESMEELQAAVRALAEDVLGREAVDTSRSPFRICPAA